MIGSHGLAVTSRGIQANHLSRRIAQREQDLRVWSYAKYEAIRASGKSIQDSEKLVRVDPEYLARETELATLRHERDDQLAWMAGEKLAGYQLAPSMVGIEQLVVQLLAPHWPEAKNDDDRHELVDRALRIVRVIRDVLDAEEAKEADRLAALDDANPPEVPHGA